VTTESGDFAAELVQVSGHVGLLLLLKAAGEAVKKEENPVQNHQQGLPFGW
jgi:hypothetical protein